MEPYFDSIFEDIRHERSLIFLLSSVEPDILSQSKFLDHEIEIIKNIAREKLHRRNLRRNYRYGSVTKTIFRSIKIIIFVYTLIFLSINDDLSKIQ